MWRFIHKIFLQCWPINIFEHILPVFLIILATTIKSKETFNCNFSKISKSDLAEIWDMLSLVCLSFYKRPTLISNGTTYFGGMLTSDHNWSFDHVLNIMCVFNLCCLMYDIETKFDMMFKKSVFELGIELA